MKKSLIVLLLVVAMIFSVIPPQQAYAASSGRLYVDGNGDTYYIFGNGYDEPGQFRIYLEEDGKHYDFAGGWQQIDGKWYFFDENSGYAYGGWYNGSYDIYGKAYYFKDCVMQTGWIQSEYGNDVWYYADPNGVLISGEGWQYIDGKWYWFENYGG
ncbi:MAG: hypothetical protein J5928_02540 [Firmicutes bacterium]|nr:hypothetical protein [Bacillota bacterium]